MRPPADSRAVCEPRVRRVQAALAARGLDALVTLAAPDVYYLAGFFYNPTERPVGLLVPTSGEPTLLIPLLDLDQEREECWVARVETYFEYPGTEHPMAWLGRTLDTLGFGRARVGVSEDQLSVVDARRLRGALRAATLVEAGDIVRGQRLVKDEGEIELIRQAARYADLTQHVGMRSLREGAARTEFELLNLVLAEVSRRMADELPAIVNVRGVIGGAVVSGQRTAFPHGTTSQRRLRPGEPVMLSFGCSVGGYRAENTRTYFPGAPSVEALELYRLVEHTQAFGRGLVRPGAACAEINRACLQRLRDAGQGGRIRHRVGHGIGLEGHEPPWLENGDPTPLVAGMVVSMEPGLYDPAVGGFLIADTVVVGPGGGESLTTSPRTLQEVTIP